MAKLTIEEIVCDYLSVTNFNLPLGIVDNSSWNPAGDVLEIENMNRLVQGVFADDYTTTAAARRAVIYVATEAGEVESFVCGARQAAVGDSTITFDLLKNGASILNATKTVNAAAGTTVQTATLATVHTFAAGDVFEVNMTISAGTGTLPKGAYGAGSFRENINA